MSSATQALPIPADANPEVTNFPGQFAKISKNVWKHHINGNTDEMNIGVDHLQGMAMNAKGDYFFFTHSRSGDNGTMIICDNDSKTRKIVQKITLPDKGYNHPGGIQQIGDILVVPQEKDVASKVIFYNLQTVTHTAPPTLLPVSISSDAHKAGGVGITKYTPAGETVPKHLVVVYDNGMAYRYQSNGQPLASTAVSFQSIGAAQQLSQGDYSTVSLATDVTGVVYMVGFRTSMSGPSYVTDYMDLYQYNASTGVFELIVANQHVITQHGATVGSYGVHFRWTGGLRIVSSTAIQALVSARNFVGGPAGATEVNIISES